MLSLRRFKINRQCVFDENLIVYFANLKGILLLSNKVSLSGQFQIYLVFLFKDLRKAPGCYESICLFIKSKELSSHSLLYNLIPIQKYHEITLLLVLSILESCLKFAILSKIYKMLLIYDIHGLPCLIILIQKYFEFFDKKIHLIIRYH